MTRPSEISAPAPGQAVQVLPAEAIFVSHGVNLGEALGLPDEVVLGDSYELEPGTEAQRLVVAHGGRGLVVAPGSQVGRPGDGVNCLGRYSLMSSDGGKVDLLLLSLTGGQGFVLPLSPMAARTSYDLVRVEDSPEDIGLSDLLCVSFARGTQITLVTGAQKAIEDLQIGERILTRDHGAQELRWIGKATLRGIGAFAPVVISAGTLGNIGDLVVSQHHRMFLYQRRKHSGMGAAELMVQAKHLVDGKRVFLRDGGFVDYFSLVFDRHEIIYAEGIPAESLMVNDATVSMLPPELATEVKSRFPGLSQAQHFGTEAGRHFLNQIGPEALYLSARTPAKTGQGL